MNGTERALIAQIDKTKQLEKRLEEYGQPDDALLRIGAPAVPFLEQVEWMRKRLEQCEAALRDIKAKAQEIAITLPVVTLFAGMYMCDVEQLFTVKHSAAAIVDAARAAVDGK